MFASDDDGIGAQLVGVLLHVTDGRIVVTVSSPQRATARSSHSAENRVLAGGRRREYPNGIFFLREVGGRHSAASKRHGAQEHGGHSGRGTDSHGSTSGVTWVGQCGCCIVHLWSKASEAWSSRITRQLGPLL